MQRDDEPRRPGLQMAHDAVVEIVALMRARGCPDDVIRRDVIRETRKHLAEAFPEGNPDPAMIGLAESQMAEVQRTLADLGV